jgi:hypothetical protein
VVVRARHETLNSAVLRAADYGSREEGAEMTVTSIVRSAERHAESVITELALASFVQDWNSGDGSLIATFEHFEWAVSYDRPLSNRFEIATFAAGAIFGPAFQFALRRHLEPVIQRSYHDGLRTMCTRWARGIVAAGPAKFGAPSFDGEDEWVAWCRAYLDDPAIADPDGGELFPADQEERLLRAYLHRSRDLALRSGWRFPVRTCIISIIH